MKVAKLNRPIFDHVKIGINWNTDMICKPYAFQNNSWVYEMTTWQDYHEGISGATDEIEIIRSIMSAWNNKNQNIKVSVNIPNVSHFVWTPEDAEGEDRWFADLWIKSDWLYLYRLANGIKDKMNKTAYKTIISQLADDISYRIEHSKEDIVEYFGYIFGESKYNRMDKEWNSYKDDNDRNSLCELVKLLYDHSGDTYKWNAEKRYNQRHDGIEEIRLPLIKILKTMDINRFFLKVYYGN